MKGTSWFLAAIAAASFSVGAQGGIVQYGAVLSGPAEATPNFSPGAGLSLFSYDTDTHTLTANSIFWGLTGSTSAAHIHCCTAVALTGAAGVATTTPSFVGFPLGVTAGVFNQTYDLDVASSFNSAFITASGNTVAGAIAALVAGMDAGKTYFNIHTSTFGGGEIRGFLTRLTPLPAAPVPLPAAAWLLVSGLGALGLFGRRVRRSAKA